MSDQIVLTRADLDDLILKAAQQGAEAAMKRLGLDDDWAGNDIRDLRDLLKLWREGKHEFWKRFCGGLALVGIALACGAIGIKLFNE